MKGRILHYDDNTGIGQISGDDGIRYNFSRANLQRLVPIAAGVEVDFDVDGKDAKEIYVLSSPAAASGFGAVSTPYSGPIEPDLGFFGYFKRAMTSYFFNFSGRARRMEYWSFWVAPVLIYVVLGILLAIGMSTSANSQSPNGLTVISIILLVVFVLATIIPGIAVQVRRLHDVGQSGWILLLLIVISFVPVLGLLSFVAYIVLGCIDSQPGSNKYGPPPKAV
jgi:uncharacterized membrane protein YhaH (DUF805 family)